MSRTLLSLALLLAACSPAPVLPGDDGPDDDSETRPDDSDEPSKRPDDTGETGLVITRPDSDDRSNLPELDCHPYDPVSYGGWTRQYNLKVGGTTGKETHTSLGLTALPDKVGAVVSVAPAYKVQVTGAGSNYNYNATYWNDCSGNALRELAYTYTVNNRTLSAATQTPQKLLPDEDEFYHTFQPAWQSDVNYKIRAPTGYSGPPLPMCKPWADGTRTVEAQYTGIGFEDIQIPGLGLVEAYRMTIILDQTQILGSNYDPLLCGIFGGAASGNPFSMFFSFFQAAAGFTPANPAEDGAYITAQIDRWYVRGVGIVKERSVDYLNQGVLLYEKTLSYCSGLPGCP